MRWLLALCVSVVILGCPASNPPVLPDAGADGGASVDSEDAGLPADAGLDAGVDAGVDAGLPNPDLKCDVPSQSGCDAGSCQLHALADGGYGSRCIEGACHLVAQNCDGGQKCSYVADGGEAIRGCVAEGTENEGQPCQGGPTQNNCKKGLICALKAGADGGLEPVCVRFCNSSAQCASPQLCYIVLTLPGSDERPLVCGAPPPSCDLLSQNCPLQTQGCYPSTPKAACFAAGAQPDGTTCVYSNDCGRGSACIGSGATGICRRLCQYPTGAPSCASGTCTPLSGFPDAGACL